MTNYYSNWEVLKGAILYAIPAYKNKQIDFVEDVKTAYIEVNLRLSEKLGFLEFSEYESKIDLEMVKRVLEDRLKLLKIGIYDLPSFKVLSCYSEKRIFEVLNFK